MKTHAEFKDDVNGIARLIANEYAEHVGVVFDILDPEEPESDIATVSMEFHRGGIEEVFEVPFSIHNHETVIVGDRDTDIYLRADSGGLYAWLFLTCLTRLTDARDQIQREGRMISAQQGLRASLQADHDRYRNALSEMSDELSHYPEGDGVFGHLKRILRRALA